MKITVLSVLGILLMLVSAETIPDEKKNQEENEIDWIEYGWFALKTAGISAAVIGGTSVVVSALGLTADSVAEGSAFVWATIFERTVALGFVLAAAGQAASTKLAVGSRSAFAAVVFYIISKRDSLAVSSNSVKAAESNETEMDDEISKADGHFDLETLHDEISTNFSGCTAGSEEETTSKKMLEILRLMEEINEDLDSEEK